MPKEIEPYPITFHKLDKVQTIMICLHIHVPGTAMCTVLRYDTVLFGMILKYSKKFLSYLNFIDMLLYHVDDVRICSL